MRQQIVGFSRLVASALFVGLLVACDSSATPPESPSSSTPTPPTPPTATPTPSRATRVRVSAYTSENFVGSAKQLTVEAWDINGTPLNTDRAEVRVSDAGVAIISDIHTIEVHNRTGTVTNTLNARLLMIGSGTVVATASMDGVSDNVSFRVSELIAGQAPLVVDSFRVVEFPVKCSWACPYLEYAPLLRLREPTGSRSVQVVAVEFKLGEQSTGLCEGYFTYSPGRTAELNGIYDYLWSNDLILVSLNGQPLPGNMATARVIVKVAEGVYQRLDVSGPVERMVASPVLPPPNGSGWSCY